MRENRTYGSEGGGTGVTTGPPYPYLTPFVVSPINSRYIERLHPCIHLIYSPIAMDKWNNKVWSSGFRSCRFNHFLAAQQRQSVAASVSWWLA